MKMIMKSLMYLVMLVTALSGCSAPAAESADPLNGTYYCQRVFIYDGGTNLRDFHNSEALGSENTTLTISGGKSVEYTYWYHGEQESVMQGSLRDTTEKDGIVTGKVFFEGDATEYTLSVEKDDAGKPKTISFVWPFGDNGNYMGLSFSGEKRPAGSAPYEELEDTADKLKDFESSETYKQITGMLENTYGSFDHTLTYDAENYRLNLELGMTGLKDALGQSADLRNTFGELCDAFDTISTSVQTVINAGGYKGITFVLHFNDGNDTLYASENGERTYVYRPDTAPAPAVTPTPSPSPSPTPAPVNTSFENTDTFRKIRQIVQESFPDSNPQVSYRKKDNMLTVTLTGGKNWEEAILNDRNSYLAWIDYTMNLQNVSSSGYDILCDEGYQEIAFTIMVVSYNDSSKALYACMNGITYYDFTED